MSGAPVIFEGSHAGVQWKNVPYPNFHQMTNKLRVNLTQSKRVWNFARYQIHKEPSCERCRQYILERLHTHKYVEVRGRQDIQKLSLEDSDNGLRKERWEPGHLNWVPAKYAPLPVQMFLNRRSTAHSFLFDCLVSLLPFLVPDDGHKNIQRVSLGEVQVRKQ